MFREFILYPLKTPLDLYRFKSGVVVYTCNPSIWELKAGRLGVQGQTGLSETVSQKQKIKHKMLCQLYTILFLYIYTHMCAYLPVSKHK